MVPDSVIEYMYNTLIHETSSKRQLRACLSYPQNPRSQVWHEQRIALCQIHRIHRLCNQVDDSLVGW
jgi:hypothetical protein